VIDNSSARTATSKPGIDRSVFGRISLLLIVVAALLLPDLTSAQQGNESSAKKKSMVYAELAKAPQKAVDRRNPLENDPDAVAAGCKLFDLHCAQCHGGEADGGKRGPSLRASKVQQATSGTLFWLLTNGVVRRGMPVWSKLPEPQRWQLVMYIKSLSSAKARGAAEKSPTP
jgi:mono/diheme cytochrome c family protein